LPLYLLGAKVKRILLKLWLCSGKGFVSMFHVKHSKETLVKSDFLIIGSGIAGLSCALKCAEFGNVVVVTKKRDIDTATKLAQGGVAAVLEEEDSVESHVGDTLSSGAGLCDEEIVRMVVKDGPDRIAELVEIGVGFVRDEKNSSGYSLGREGGHSHRRVVHAYDSTGREIERALLDKVRSHSGIRLVEEQIAVDLLMVAGSLPGWDVSGGQRCVGAYVMVGEEVVAYRAKVTILCSGGIGKV